MAKGVYQGVATQEAARDTSLWGLGQGFKGWKGRTEDVLGKRNIWDAISNIGEKALGSIPGWGKVLEPIADITSEQLKQEVYKIPEYEGKGGFWGAPMAEKYREFATDVEEGANVSLGESITRKLSELVSGGIEGGEGEGFDFSNLLGGNAKYGGKIPKYKKGGGFFGFGKKDIVSERDQALVALDAILSKDYEMKEGKHEYPFGRNVASGETYPDGSNLVRTIAKFSTQEGERYYPGEGKSRSNSLANRIAMMDAAQRAHHAPSDSITTDQLAKLKELGLFAGGGQVPKYYGGGSVSGSPTITGYFSQQGKTLGGSNTQSLAEKLGMK